MCHSEREKSFLMLDMPKRSHLACSDFGLFVAVGGEVAKVKRKWWLRFDIGKCTHSVFVCLPQPQNFRTA